MRAPDFWTSTNAFAKALAALLSPLGALYGLGTTFAKFREPFRPRASVICVGNLTAGGTGKTPIAIALARMIAARGKKAVFVTRGYGGSLAGPVLVNAARHGASEVGDEALLFAASGPTVVARDRAAGAAAADRLGADAILLDDGHQNFSVAKDLSLVVIDAEIGFGNGHLIPAGPLRESVGKGLSRADAVILMGEGDPRLDYSGPVIRARLVPTAGDSLLGRKVFAFAGIGRPEKFFRTVRELGAIVGGAQGFADHHVYSRLELAALRGGAERLGLDLVTTEKDYVRIEPRERKGIAPVPVHVVFADSSEIERLLDRVARPGD